MPWGDWWKQEYRRNEYYNKTFEFEFNILQFFYTTTHFVDYDVKYIPSTFEITSYVPYLKNVYVVNEYMHGSENKDREFIIELICNYQLNDIRQMVNIFGENESKNYYFSVPYKGAACCKFYCKMCFRKKKWNKNIWVDLEKITENPKKENLEEGELVLISKE